MCPALLCWTDDGFDMERKVFSELIDEAMAAASSGNLDRAGELWRELREHFADQPGTYLAEAVAARDSGDLASADALVGEAVERFPYLAVAGIEHANLALMRGDQDAANARFAALHARLTQRAAFCREAGDLIGLNAALSEIVQYFPKDMEAATAYVGLVTDIPAKRARWAALPAGSKDPLYYKLAWDLARADLEAGRDDTPPQILETLVTEPFGGDEWFAPHFVREWCLLNEYHPTLGAAFVSRLQAYLAEAYVAVGKPLPPAGEMAAAAMEMELPPIDRLALLARLLLQDDFRRLSLIFCPEGNIRLVPGLAEMLVQGGGLDRIPPAQLYNVSVILKCVDQDQWERFNRAAVEANPPETRLSTPLGILNLEHGSRVNRVAVPNDGRRLKIALCISGQLREFRAAFPTWRSLGLDRHDVDIYVHTWCAVGKKPPLPMHADRVFRPNFAQMYRTGFAEVGGGAMHARYPRLFGFFFGDSLTVTEQDLTQFYGAARVVVEDDRIPPHSEVSTPIKMHYKIQECFNLARQSGKPYDLVVRTRPDLGFAPETPVDWNEIHHVVTRDRAIFNGGNPDFLTGPLGHKIGDLWAIGDMECMTHYSEAFSEAYRAHQQGFHGAPSCIAGHLNLAYQMLIHGVRVYDLGIPMKLSLVDCVLDGQALLDILLQDMNGQPRDDLDTRMLAACRADMA